jgi:hypothetical protein
VFSWYLKECLLKMKQFFFSCGQSTKIEPLDSQRVGPGSGQPRLTKLEHCIMLFGIGKC